MGTSGIASTLGICFVAAASAFAADAQTGTWKLNEAKSKLGPDATRNHTVVYTDVGENVKVTVEGVHGSGAYRSEWTGKFDGKDYPITGDPVSDMRSYTKIDDRTLALTAKKDGKVIATGRITVSPDGRSRTVTMTATSAEGRKVTSTAVYDKQE